MTKPRVFNVRDGRHPDAVFIGRPSRWGNPFVVGKHGTRVEVIAKYENWLKGCPALVTQMKRELKGKNLMCFCAPAACHGDVILRIANE